MRLLFPHNVFAFIFVCLVLGVGASGCGFHLRSSDEINLPAITVSGETSSLVSRLKHELDLVGVTMVSDESPDGWMLVIHQSKRERRVMSVDSDGKAQEFELRQTVSFSVMDKASEKSIARRQLSRSRDLLFDKNEVLGKSYEESLLYQDIEVDIVNTLIWNLRALSQSRDALP